MFNFFKKTDLLSSYAFLGLDFHSHLLPGIDDGSPDMETTLSLIRDLQAMGFEHLFTTPHVMADMYPNTPEIISSKLADVKQAMADAGIDISIQAAAEYLMDESFGDKIKNRKLLTLPGNRVLVEMSFISEPPNLGQYIFELQTRAYNVVLAHPERYLFLRDEHLQRYTELREQGVEFQLNLLSLTGYYGKPVRDTAVALLKAGLVDYLATDLHHEGHAQNLEQLLADRKINKLLSSYKDSFKNRQLLAERSLQLI